MTVASLSVHPSSQIVPHWPLINTSTRPSFLFSPSISLIEKPKSLLKSDSKVKTRKYERFCNKQLATKYSIKSAGQYKIIKKKKWEKGEKKKGEERRRGEGEREEERQEGESVRHKTRKGKWVGNKGKKWNFSLIHFCNIFWSLEAEPSFCSNFLFLV